MGKKKDERKRREREAEMAAGRECGGAREGHKPEDRKHARGKHDGAAPIAGIAAAVAKQLATPAGRQMVAAGLMMAAAAISRQDTKAGTRTAPPAPPEPPVTPVTPDAAADARPLADDGAHDAAANPYAGTTPEPPRGETPPVSPEIAKVIGAVTSGLEGLFAGFGKPRNGPPKV